MHYDLAIKNGTLVTSAETRKTDIAVKDGKISFIGDLNGSETVQEVYDAAGLYILPGIIDAHVHFRDPGLTEKEDFETGSIAAAMGGITCIMDMPNVIPTTSTAAIFCEKVKIAGEKSYIDFGLFALLNNDNTNEIEALVKAGAVGFKVFLGTSTGDIAAPSPETLDIQLKKCAVTGTRTGFHAETSEINAKSTALCKEKYKKSADYESCGIMLSEARPIESEVLAVKKALDLARLTNANIHIHHVTCKEGSDILAKAKLEGLPVTVETCPHYLFLNAENSSHKCYPPIRDKDNQKALWQAVKDGTIDMIATDHAPHGAAEKNLPVWDMPAGLSGIETFVNLFLNEVNKGRLTLNDVVRLTSENPAKIWGIYPQKGSIAAGADADFTIVDMNKKVKIEADKLYSKSKTTPYDGWELQGAPAATIVRGKFVMKNGELTGSKGYGKLLVNKK